ncbi:hypothetical protein [Aureivirga marina]|uniref:hypothetical protein n=1 Tax=Aureivirga marina TaxID=1182451 RepID=UPI0018C9AB72|nr:hypothetical protein [Aureivirga marina]
MKPKLPLARQIVLIFFFSFSFLFTSCDPFDCIIPSGPELPSRKPFTVGANRDIYFEIEAEVKNSYRDDRFDYHFTVDGEFPSTLHYRVKGRRTLVFYGVIQQQGNFTFTVNLSVEDLDYYDDIDYDTPFLNEDGDGLCYSHTSENYTIEVVKNLVITNN